VLAWAVAVPHTGATTAKGDDMGWGTSTTRRPRAIAAMGLAMTALLLAACGTADGTLGTTATTAAAPQIALLTHVSIVNEGAHDVVIFQFSNFPPIWQVTAVSRPIEADPSGRPVAISGATILQVKMQPASGVDLSQPGAPRTYTGPTTITFDGASVVQVVQVGDFEGVLTWDIGLRQTLPYVTMKQPDPASISVVIDHPATAAPPAGVGFTG
jgi:hypothetical protein